MLVLGGTVGLVACIVVTLIGGDGGLVTCPTTRDRRLTLRLSSVALQILHVLVRQSDGPCEHTQ